MGFKEEEPMFFHPQEIAAMAEAQRRDIVERHKHFTSRPRLTPKVRLFLARALVECGRVLERSGRRLAREG